MLVESRAPEEIRETYTYGRVFEMMSEAGGRWLRVRRELEAVPEGRVEERVNLEREEQAWAQMAALWRGKLGILGGALARRSEDMETKGWRLTKGRGREPLAGM